MVLAAHILGGTARHIYAGNPDYVSGTYNFWVLGTHGVQIFFVISGFVIWPSAARYSAKEFFLRRFFRIYPLFFVLCLVFIGLNLVTNEYAKINNLRSVVSGLLFLNLFTGTEQLTPNAWSLTYEAWFYVLAAAVAASMRDAAARWKIVASGAACCLFLLFQPISLYFLAGVGIRLLYDRPLLSRHALRIVEVASFLCMLFFASRQHYEYYWRDFLGPNVIPGLVSTALFFYAAVHDGSFTSRLLSNRFAMYVGTVSYSLYLVHPYAYYVTRLVFSKAGLFTSNIPLSLATFAAAVVLSSFALTHIIHITLERRPYELFFRQKIYHRTRSGGRSAKIPVPAK